MFPVATEESRPARRFATREEAKAIADAITNMPRKGEARVQFTGAWDCWIVEIRPRSNPYGNPAVLRQDGTAAKYH